MMSETAVFKKEYEVTQEDFVKAGEVSSSVKQVLRQLGIKADIIRKIAIASYEAELNMTIHSYGGAVILEVSEENVSLVFADTGPGIPDVDKAMQEGFSTASEAVRNMGFGAGMGLPNIKRCSDFLDIQTSPEGTTITVEIKLTTG